MTRPIRASSLALALGMASCGSCGGGHRTLAGISSRAPTAELRWGAPIEVASGEARSGPWRMNESEFHYVDDPTVAVAADGSAFVAWVDNRAQTVRVQRYDRGGQVARAAPVEVSASPEIFSWLPQIQVSDDGERVFVLWQEIVFSGGSHGGEAFFARSTDGGKSFEAPLNLSRSKAGDGKGRLTAEIWNNGSLDLALAADGTLIAAWTEYEGPLWLSRSTDGGASFGEPIRVAGTSEAPARGPDLAVGPDGAAFLVWAVGESDSADIHLARSTDGGRTFGPPRIPVKSRGHSDAPRIALDSTGQLHLVWAESPGGRFRDYHVAYARLDREGRVIARARPIADPDGVERAHFPDIGVISADDVVVIWERFPERRFRPRGLGVAISRDGGQRFSPPALIPGTADPELGQNGGLQGHLGDKLAVGAGGHIAVVNSRFDEGTASRVRLFLGSF